MAVKPTDPKAFKGYVSELDKFLQEFNRRRTSFPASMLEEVAKHQQGVFKKRDHPTNTEQPLL